MDLDIHPLKSLLQLQLATDSSTALFLPYILHSLSYECFKSSPYLPRWTSRLNLLLHSKDPGGRWAGLVLAYETSIYSKEAMIENGQSWLAVALPLLSKSEPLPILKSALNLCRLIVTAAADMPEFQRQVSSPNIPKLTAAILACFERELDSDFKVFKLHLLWKIIEIPQILLLNTLSKIVKVHPSAHRASYTTISNVSLRYLNGSWPCPVEEPVMRAASQLFSCLPSTGGKVGAVGLWRNALDETLGIAWTALASVRTTFPDSPQSPKMSPNDDPHMVVPLNLGKLKACTTVICDLLSTRTSRHVTVPIGSLVSFVTSLLLSNTTDKIEGFVDPGIRAMEVFAAPSLWEAACVLTVSLAKCARHHLSPHISRIMTMLSYHLEQRPPHSLAMHFVAATLAVLSECQQLHSQAVVTRLAKCLLPYITTVLPSQSDVQRGVDSSKVKGKGKKRTRGFEGDETFKASRSIIFGTTAAGVVALQVCDALRFILPNPTLAPAVHSLLVRIILSISVYLPQTPVSALSPNPTCHRILSDKISGLCGQFATGSTSRLSKSLGLILRVTDSRVVNEAIYDLVLHPRLPPLWRSNPALDALALSRSGEGKEEAEIRHSMGLAYREHTSQDVDMEPPNVVEDAQVLEDMPVAAPTMSEPPPPPLPPRVMAPPEVTPINSREVPELVFEPPIQAILPSAPLTTNEMGVEDEEMPDIDLDSDSDHD